MVYAILIGRRDSKGLPGKNSYKILGRPLVFYPLNAALRCPGIDGIYMSTDDEHLMAIGRKYKINIIRRPAELCSDSALCDDVFKHAYHKIKEMNKPGRIDLLVLLMCNAVTITPELISEGIKVLRQNPAYDSAVTVSRYNMWSPVRARRIGRDGLLYPFLPFKAYESVEINCNRDTQGDVWFADMGVSVVRPRCLENVKNGLLPQKWMGRKIYPLKQWGGLDVDYEWQIPMAEYWLKKHGIKRL